MNLGNPREMTILEFADAFSERRVSQRRSEFKATCRRTIRSGGSPTSQRREQILGWEPEVSLEDGMRETLEYFRSRDR